MTPTQKKIGTMLVKAYIFALNNKYTWCDLTDNCIKLYVSCKEILLRKYSGRLILREPKCNLDVLPYN